MLLKPSNVFCRGHTVKQEIPWVVVDTGTLLTLLLGGEGKHGLGYTPLLAELAKKKLIHLAIPDMVLSEFMGALTPLRRKDFAGDEKFFDADKNIPYGFSKARERVAFVKDLLDSNAAEIIRTPCGDEYLQRLQTVLVDNPDYKRVKDKEWPLDVKTLRRRLSSPHSHLYKAVKQNSLVDAVGNTVSSGKQDRGELAVADTLRIIHEKHGQATPAFALFEGSDVRGRIIQRLLSAPNTADYDQLHGELLDKYNPGRSEFVKKEAATLGNINFLSTKAFLAGFMKAAKELSVAGRVNGMPEWYILHPDEAKNNGDLNKGYRELMTQVQEHGLGRAYDKYRDRPITDMSPEDEHEYAMVKQVPQNAPWMKQVSSYLENSQQREVLRDIIHVFVKKRQKALLKECEESFETIFRNIPKMFLETASALMIMLTKQMGEVAKQVEHKFEARAA